MTLKYKYKKQKGAYLAIAAISVFLFLLLCAGALGIGFVITTKTQMQNISNLTSLSVLEKYVRPDNQALTNLEKKTEAFNHANTIIGHNKLPGTANNLAIQDENQIVMGMYYPELPEDGSDPCGNDVEADYPCFKEISDINNEPVNALKLTISTDASPVLAPIAKIIGKESWDVSSTSYAAITQRCTAYLIDISPSVVLETHPMLDPIALIGDNDCFNPVTRERFTNVGVCPAFDNLADSRCNPSGCIAHPSNFNAATHPDFAHFHDVALYNADRIEITGAAADPPVYGEGKRFSFFAFDDSIDTADCDNGEIWGNLQRNTWCNMDSNRGGADMSEPTLHFRNDFSNPPLATRDRLDQDGNLVTADIYVDQIKDTTNDYIGPQPMTNYFLSFNAGLHNVLETSSQLDRAMMMVFTGRVIDRFPFVTEDNLDPLEDMADLDSDPNPDPPMSPNLEFMVQLTNMDNRGVNDLSAANPATIHPNFVDLGWVPRYNASEGYAGTNIIKALEDTIQLMKKGCPATSKKSIILATDGMSTCDFDSSLAGLGNYDLNGYFCPLFNQPDLIWEAYQASENSISDLVSNADGLLANDIALTVLLSGRHVNPHFKNIENPDHPNFASCADGYDQSCYLTYEQALARNIGNLFFSGESSYYDSLTQTATTHLYNSAGLGEKNAFLTVNNGQSFTGRPIKTLAHATLATGGIMCPLLETADETNYSDHDSDSDTPKVLNNNQRINGGMQYKSVEYLTKAEQAAKCVINTIGTNPFTLVEPRNIQ